MTDNKFICDYEGIRVTREHLKNLVSKDRFMNDEIINAYLYILQTRKGKYTSYQHSFSTSTG